MTVFKAFLGIVSKNKFIIILYAGMLILFGGISIQTPDNNSDFTASKPVIAIVNNDKSEGITENLIKYLSENSDVIETKNEDEVSDGLFYRSTHYAIFIPENYNDDFLDGKDPKLEVKKTSDYHSSFAEILLSRFLKVASIYRDDPNIIERINNALSDEATVDVVSEIDTGRFARATTYYNFASYSILANLIYIICIVISSFENQKIKSRNLISATSYKTINRNLLMSNLLFAGVIWLFYVAVSFFLVGGDVMISLEGLLYIINSFIFTLLSTTIAFFISKLVSSSKDAVNGVVNVVALGSSFLCGVFIPLTFLPDGVVSFAHLLPTYYYVDANNTIQNLEEFSLETISPIIINMVILLGFSLLFFGLTNLVTKKRRL